MWQRQATQTDCVNCQVGKDRQHKHIVSIVKLAKTSNTNTLFQLLIVKLEKTGNTNTFFQLSSWHRQATQTHSFNC